MLSLAELVDKILPLIGKSYNLPKTKNKGLPGLYLETLAGIQHTSNCLDCSDGELKVVPLKKTKKGLVQKETIAVTMIQPELKTQLFPDSRCYKKLNNLLVVPYLRTGDIIVYMQPYLVNKEKYPVLYKILEEDYYEIQKLFNETGILESKNGKVLQTRTKGAGHGSKSRAFYLRTCFLSQLL
uniref:DNA mismatch repair MutH/Type II restriction enzyme Sau3AI domain-containing protein n=1 Tax=viral metagenome TaxID=1070528 RepID=A0A6C0JII1_9ZZZZ